MSYHLYNKLELCCKLHSVAPSNIRWFFNYNGSELSACSSEGRAAGDAASAPRASTGTRVLPSRQWVPSASQNRGLKHRPPWNKTQSRFLIACRAQQPRLPVLTTSATSRGCTQDPAHAQGRLRERWPCPRTARRPCARAAPTEGFPHLMGASFRRGEAIQDSRRHLLPS